MALTFLKTCHFGNARLVSWMLAIQNFQTTVEHFPGKENIDTDLISRVHLDKDWDKEKETCQLIIHNLKCEFQRTCRKT